MKKILSMVVGTVLLGLCISSSTSAQEQTAKLPDDQSVTQRQQATAEVTVIRAGSEAFVAAFNKADAKAIAAMWTEDGEYVDDTGRHFMGRAAIEKGYAEYFAGNPNPKIQITIDALRMLSNNAAIEDGRAVADPSAVGAAGFSEYTAMHVKVNGKWLMASVRDRWVATPEKASSAADLEWLVGTWVAEEHGAKIESVCSWVANKSFIERRYTTTLVDGTKMAGVQLIGWNPNGGHVQSWDFSPDGGHAVGTWFPQQDGWSSEMRGVTSDGTLTASINLLRRLDNDAYVWQSVQRTAGGDALPDTDEVVLKRQPESR